MVYLPFLLIVNLDLFALNVYILLNKMANNWGRFSRLRGQEFLIEIEASFGSMSVISYIPNLPCVVTSLTIFCN